MKGKSIISNPKLFRRLRRRRRRRRRHRNETTCERPIIGPYLASVHPLPSSRPSFSASVYAPLLNEEPFCRAVHLYRALGEKGQQRKQKGKQREKREEEKEMGKTEKVE